jgi:molybdate transport system regulatory protein
MSNTLGTLYPGCFCFADKLHIFDRTNRTAMDKNIEIKFRHWVFVDEMKFFGPGRLELLEHIDHTGSIVQAAKAMGMSYKKAWAMVDHLNTHGRQPYVITHKGGQQGGGTELTETAKAVIAAYKKLNTKLHEIVTAENELLTLI